MNAEEIRRAVREVMRRLPPDVELVAAAKTRTVEEVQAAVAAGVRIVGHNYVQEAEKMIAVIGRRVKWHMIGRLQSNKAGKAAKLFDMIETLDSFALAEALERHCRTAGKTLPVLVEVNSAREPGKTGIFPEEVEDFVRRASTLPHVAIRGLMTMGPPTEKPEEVRPFFRQTSELFKRLAEAKIPGVEMRVLSMGMSSSYEVAIEEGANMVRIGTKLFGERAR